MAASTSDAGNAKSEPILAFQCQMCGLKEKYHYLGKNPPFAKSYVFLEDAYVAKDPFNSSTQHSFLLLGGSCSLCQRVVCQHKNCSVFFAKRFCLQCAKENINKFPREIQVVPRVYECIHTLLVELQKKSS